jgi:ATP-dependent RNA helicase DDX54/DBP10
MSFSFSLMKSFDAEANNAVMDLAGDDDQSSRAKKNVMRWDARKKKYVRDENESTKRKIRTESGVWIPASYKSDRYSRWKEQSKLAQMQEQEEEQGGDGQAGAKRGELIYLCHVLAK